MKLGLECELYVGSTILIELLQNSCFPCTIERNVAAFPCLDYTTGKFKPKEITTYNVEINGLSCLVKEETNSTSVVEPYASGFACTELAFDPYEHTVLADKCQPLLTWLEQAVTGRHPDLSIQLNLDVSSEPLDAVMWLAYSDTYGSTPRSRERFITPLPQVLLDWYTQNKPSVEHLAQYYFTDFLASLLRTKYNPSIYEDLANLIFLGPVSYLLKHNRHRISSLLLTALPDDWLKQKLLSFNYIWDIPVVEFREFNSDFELVSKIDFVRNQLETARRSNY